MSIKVKDFRKKILHEFNWSRIKQAAIIIIAITMVISLLEFNNNMGIWIRDILGNFVIVCCIGFSNFIIAFLHSESRFNINWKHLLGGVLFLAIGGALGGLLAWGINDILFSFYISHPFYYLLITSGLSIIIGLVINGFVLLKDKLKESAERLAESEIKMQRIDYLKTIAELKALRAKFNPHFFFNTLNSIASLISSNPKKAEEIVERLSNLFHYTLDASNSDFVKLSDEIEFLNEYLEIEKVRLGKRLNFNIFLDETLADFLIPGMILQSVVENSIIHGISPIKEGGKLTVNCKRKENTCIIEVIDSGLGFDKSTVNEGFGIGGLRERLDLHYGENYYIDIKVLNGVRVTIKIPINKK